MMKKVLFAIVFSFSSALLCFSLPNIKLYQGARFDCSIKNDKIYDEHNDLLYEVRNGKVYYSGENLYVGIKISENNEYIVFERFSDNKLKERCEYDKKSGFLRKKKSYEEKLLVELTEYDEKTGFIAKDSFYSDGKIQYFLIYECDKHSGKILKDERRNSVGNIILANEYDVKTGKKIKTYFYNDDGSCRMYLVYDKKSGKEIERYIYASGAKKPQKYVFLAFDDNGEYKFDDANYLSLSVVDYSELKGAVTGSIDWNDSFFAKFSICDFDTSKEGYKFIKT